MTSAFILLSKIFLAFKSFKSVVHKTKQKHYILLYQICFKINRKKPKSTSTTKLSLSPKSSEGNIAATDAGRVSFHNLWFNEVNERIRLCSRWSLAAFLLFLCQQSRYSREIVNGQWRCRIKFIKIACEKLSISESFRIHYERVWWMELRVVIMNEWENH